MQVGQNKYTQTKGVAGNSANNSSGSKVSDTLQQPAQVMPFGGDGAGNMAGGASGGVTANSLGQPAGVMPMKDDMAGNRKSNGSMGSVKKVLEKAGE